MGESLQAAMRAVVAEEDELGVALQRAELRARLFGDRLARPTFGRYEIIREVGAGGMGCVYLAEDPKLRRRVAVKTVSAAAEDADAAVRRRMLREAQAMARVDHPNVVPVFDVGLWERGVFVAMEYVPGPTLREWLEDRPRDWSEIVRMYRAAGRGLVAIHESDLHHRDFKPDNVIVGEGGVPRVVDFGLTALAGAAEAPHNVSSDPLGALGEEMTEAGALVGTPAYMSPEQRSGAATGASSDQYAFCVALWEALCGERPEPDRAWPDGASHVPRRIRRALRRGLEADGRSRWPSMDTLLAALEKRRVPRTAWTAWTAGVAAAGIALVVGAGWLDDPAASCEPPAPIGTEGGPLAEYARELDAAFVAACRSEPESRATLACLHRRRGAAEVLAKQLEERAKGSAVTAVAALPPVGACSTPQAESFDPPAEAIEDAVAEVRRTIAEAQSRYALGDYAAADQLAEQAVDDAVEIGYTPAVAEARTVRGLALEGAGRYASASRELGEAVYAAQATRHDDVLARAATELVFVDGYHFRRPADGESWGRHAAAAIERLGGNDVYRARLLRNLGLCRRLAGKVLDAEEAFEEALMLRIAAFGQDHPDVAQSYNNLGAIHYSVGRIEDARSEYAKSVAIYERVLEPDHPTLAMAIDDLGSTHQYFGQLALARQHFERALEIRRSTLSEDHPHMGTSWINLGQLARKEGRFVEARTMLERARDVAAGSRGTDHPKYALALLRLASVAIDREEPAAAIGPLNEALTIFTATFGEDHHDVRGCYYHLYEAHTLLGDEALAAEYKERLQGAADLDQ